MKNGIVEKFKGPHKLVSALIFFALVLQFSMNGFAQHAFFHLLGINRLQAYTWTGYGADANWTTGQNWSDNAPPGPSDIARFVTSACASNCSPTINTSINIGGINVDATYPGTITQAAGQSVLVGSSGWAQAGGTFVGSDSGITINSTFSLTGGSFTSTSGQMLVTSGFATVGGTFLHNSGTLKFDNNGIVVANSTVNVSVPAGLQLWNLQYSGGYAAANGTYKVNIAAGGFDVLNNFQIGLTAAGATGAIFASGGSIQVKGNVVVDPSVKIEANTTPTNLILNGTGAQTYASTSTGRLPSLTIDKVSGSVAPLGGTTNLIVDGFTNTAGSFTAPPGVFTVLGNFAINGGTYSENSGAMVFDRYAGGGTSFTVSLLSALNVTNLSFGGGQPAAATAITWTLSGATPRFNASGNLNISNTQGGTGNILVNGGDIYLAGNYVAGAYSGAGTAALTFNGTGAQTFTKTGAGANLAGNVNVDKSAGTLTLATVAALSGAGQDFTVTTGTVNMAGFGLNVADVLTIGVNGRLLCNGGVATYTSFVVNGEVSCGPSIGITWTGLAANNQWATAGNWTNNTIPGASDVAVFNSKCSGANCDATMQAVVSVKGFRLNSDYPGTLTAATTVTVGTTGFTQAGGTYAGVNSTKTVSGPYVLSGGTYTATTGNTTFSINPVTFTVSGAPTFNHSSGTLTFAPGFNGPANLTIGNQEFYNVRFTGPNNAINVTGTFNVNGLLTFDETNVAGGALNLGVILAKGDISLVGWGKKSGDGILRIGGTADQTVSVSSGVSPMLPTLEIAKTGGTVEFLGSMTMSRHFTYVSGNTDFSTSTLTFAAGNSRPQTITAGSPIYNNVTIASTATAVTLVGDMTVAGELIFSDDHASTPASIDGANFLARGNVSASRRGNVGSTIVKIVGNTDQTISGVSGSLIPNVEILSTGGTVFLSGTVQVRGNFIYGSGVVDAGTSTLMFQRTQGSQSWTPGPVSYYNVNSTGSENTLNLTGDATVLGTLTINDIYAANPGNLNGANIFAHGDVLAIGGGRKGNTVIKVVGGTDQTVMGESTAYFPSLEVDSTGGTVRFVGTIRPQGNLIWNAGTLNATTSLIEFYTAGAISIVGTPTFNDVNFTGSNVVRNLTGTLRTAGNLLLSFNSTTNRHINGGFLQALGDVNARITGSNGSTLLSMEGATSTILSVLPSVIVLPTGTVTVNKSGGSSVTLATNVSFPTAGQDINVTSGTLNMAGSNLTIPDVLTVGAAGTVLCNGGTLTYGSLVNAGTVTCGASPFLWSGAGGNSNWDNAANWSGGIVPGVNDLAEFSSASGVNSDVTLNVNVDVKGLRMNTGYTGTITQSAGVTIVIGDRGWFQNAGTFLGSNAAITLNGNMTLNGGSYRATSGTTTSEFNFLVNNTPTFTANNGTFVFTGANGGSTISAGSTQFFNLTLAGTNGVFKLNSSTVTANGTLTMGDSVSASGGVSNGTIVARSNVVINQEGYSGNANLIFDGTSGTLNVAALASTFSGTITVNRRGFLTLTSAASFANISGQDFALTMGTLNLNGNTLTTADLSLANYTNLVCGGGTYPSATLTNAGATINCGVYPFNWTGAGANSNWSTAANWSGGVAPNNTQVAYFRNANCGVNCNATITANPNVRGIVMMPDYTGTITQNAGVAISVGNVGWTQSSGTFVGSNSAITVQRYLFLAGGSFQSTTNTLKIADSLQEGSHYAISNSTAFTANSGTFHLEGNCNPGYTAETGSFTYNHYIVSGGCSTIDFRNSTINVAGDFTVPVPNYSSSINNATLRIGGNVSISENTGTGATWFGNYSLEMIGNPLGQTINGVAVPTRIQNLVLNTGTNPLTLAGTVRIGRNLTVVSANPANVTTTGSTLTFSTESNFATSMVPGTINYNNLEFIQGSGSSINLNSGTMTVNGNLVIYGNGGSTSINSGTFNVGGNVTTAVAGATTPNGTAVVRMIGNAAGRVITGVSTIRIPNLEIATGANPVTMSGSVRINNAMTVTSGSPNMSGAALTTQSLALGGNTLTKSGGVLTVNSVVAGTGSLFGGTVAP